MNAQQRICRPREAVSMLGVSKSTLWRMVKDGIIPPPIKIGRQAVGWRSETLSEFINSRPSAR